MKQAVCVLIVNHGKVLAVARRGTTDQFGLPGGKVDNGESLIDAVVRETGEETGLILDPKFLKEIYSAVCGNDYKTTTFFYNNSVTDISQGDAGPVEFITWEELEAGPFGDYNTALHERYTAIMDNEKNVSNNVFALLLMVLAVIVGISAAILVTNALWFLCVILVVAALNMFDKDE
jgi:8-oxo-dGTP pyrophosphatase MutT (NUDIX family)